MSKKASGAFLLVVLGAVWGSSFMLMKLGMSPQQGVRVFNFNQVASLRILVATIVLLPFSLSSIRILFQQRGPYLLIVGLCGNLIPSFLFTYANTQLSSGVSGILNSFTPVFTVVIGAMIFKTSIHWLQIMGILVSTLGVIFLLSAGVSFQEGAKVGHFAAVLCATFLYGISVNTIKNKLFDINPLQVTSLALLSIFPIVMFSFLYEKTPLIFSKNPLALEAFGYIFVLGLLSTALSNIYFNRLIQLTSALFASSVTYLIPLFAVIFGSLNNEKLSWLQLLAMIVLLAGVFLINFYELFIRHPRNKRG